LGVLQVIPSIPAYPMLSFGYNFIHSNRVWLQKYEEFDELLERTALMVFLLKF